MRNVLICWIVLLTVGIIGATAIAGDIKSAGAKGNWSAGSTWVGGVVPGAADNVTIANGDTVTLDVSATITSLTVGEGTTGAFLFNKTGSVKLTINGNLLVKVGAVFKVQTRAAVTPEVLDTLYITGNITNQGAGFDLRGGTAGSSLSVCNVVFTGSGNSTITMGSYTSSTNEFNGMVFDKSGSGRVILGSDVVSGGGSSSQTTGDPIWTFKRGMVETGPYAMIHVWTSASAVAGASDLSYVLGAMGRGMSNSGGSERTFQIGDARGYRPVKVRSTTAGGTTGHYVRVQAIAGNANPGTSSFAGNIDKVSAVRYFKITYSQGGSTTANMSFDRFTAGYGSDDGVAGGNQNLRVATADSARVRWTGQGPTATPYTTALDSLPRFITSDALTTPIQLASGASINMALARLTGTQENSLAGATSVERISDLPSSFSLGQNYPNPFNPSTNVRFNIRSSGLVTLKVYDVLGNEIATLVNREMGPGTYVASWDAGRFDSGVYFCRLQSGGFIATTKMTLVK
ncbi:MAG TPA: hypothetical protein DCP63_14675 [Bacteroidetes bacterium]|nr:hypothetical protein [Bacteroidota bacterium]